MINKFLIRSIISKCSVGGLIEANTWSIQDNKINIEFCPITKNVVGKVTTNLTCDDMKLPIFDLKKFSNLIEICSNDLAFKIIDNNRKIKISDDRYDLVYALANEMLIPKVPKIEVGKWTSQCELNPDILLDITKAIQAVESFSNLVVISNDNDADGNKIIRFTFGEQSVHSNTVTYTLLPDVEYEEDFAIPFDSTYLKSILNANKDLPKGNLYIQKDGLIKLEFEGGEFNISSTYHLPRIENSNY